MRLGILMSGAVVLAGLYWRWEATNRHQGWLGWAAVATVLLCGAFYVMLGQRPK